MRFTQDFSRIPSEQKTRVNKLELIEFPTYGNTPVVSIDFDGTLAEYDGWKGHDHTGKPLPGAIWALKVFQHNGYEVEIFTSRTRMDFVWRWVYDHAHGLVKRVNKTRKISKNHSCKPVVDIFIDDKSEYWVGKKVNWREIIRRLLKRGFFPRGILEGEEMLGILDVSEFRDYLCDIQEESDICGQNKDVLGEIERYFLENSKALNEEKDQVHRATVGGKLLHSVLVLLTQQNLDPFGCLLLANQKSNYEMPEM